MRTGWLYIFTAPQGVKVGITTSSVEVRRRGVETGSGTPISLFRAYEVPIGALRVLEERIHALLRETSTFGEWFDCRPDEAAAAVTLALSKQDIEVAPLVIPSNRIPLNLAQLLHVAACNMAPCVLWDGQKLLIALSHLGERCRLGAIRDVLAEPNFEEGYAAKWARSRGYIAAWMDVLVITELGLAHVDALMEVAA